MAMPVSLKQFLTAQKIKHKALKHETAYTAQEMAAAQHVPGKQVAKSVLVKTDKGYVLAVLPAIHLIDFAKFKKVAKVKKASLASEQEIEKLTPGFAAGATPPFGTLFNIPTVADKLLGEDVEIVFSAGSHTDSVKITYADLARVTKPIVGAFGKHI